MAMIKNQVGISLTLFFFLRGYFVCFSVAFVHCIFLFIVVTVQIIIYYNINDVLENHVYSFYTNTEPVLLSIILENNRSIVESPRVFKKSLLVSFINIYNYNSRYNK